MAACARACASSVIAWCSRSSSAQPLLQMGQQPADLGVRAGLRAGVLPGAVAGAVAMGVHGFQGRQATCLRSRADR